MNGTSDSEVSDFYIPTIEQLSMGHAAQAAQPPTNAGLFQAPAHVDYHNPAQAAGGSWMI